MRRSRNVRALRPAIVAACIAVASMVGIARPVLSQTPTGVIDGIVRDPSGLVVPGVTVVANSPSLIQRDLTAFSNPEGYYRLQLLPPGTYTVSYELQGFQTFVREGLIVAAGQTTSMNIQLPLASLQQSVTVFGGSPIIDHTSANLGFTTTKDLVQNVPTRRDFSALMATIPGVEGPASNTSQAGNFPRLVVLGAGTMANNYTFDGSTVLDPGISSDQTAKFSYDIVEEVQVIKAAKPAEVGFAQGGSFQIITKSGGNEFHGEAGGYFRDDALQSNNVTDELRRLGVTSTSNAVVEAYDIAISPGGGIIRDRLWWFGSARRQRDELQLLGFPDNQVSKVNAFFWKNTFQASPSHRFMGSFQDWDEKVVPFFRGFAPSLAGDRFATFVRNPSGQLTMGRWNGTLSDTVTATVGVAYGKQTLTAVYPEGATVGVRDLVTGVRTGSPDVLQKFAPSWNTSVSGSLAWFVPDLHGRHDFKVGTELTRSKVVNEMFSVDGHNLRVNNGVPAQVVFFDTPAVGDARINLGALYAQDSWVIGNKLTLNLGLRYDRFVPRREASEAGGGTFPNTELTQIFPILNRHAVHEIDPQWKWNSFAPRLAGSYAIDERTVVRTSYSRYYHFINTGMIPGGDENVVTSVVVQWDDRNGDRRFQVGEQGRLLSFVEGVSRVRFDPDIKHPFTDEVVFGVSRELFTNFSINANFIWRRDDDLVHTVQIGIPDSAYSPVTVDDPGISGGGTITVFAQDPATFGQEEFLETNPNKLGKDNDRRYKGFEFVANKRLSNRWQFVGSVVVQRMESLTPTSSFFTTGLFQNPNDQINARGRDPLSETVILKLQGVYQAPFGVLLSGYYRFGSGSPITRTLVVRGLPQGTITVLAEPRGERETANSNLLDFRVEKAFGMGAGRRLLLGLDIFNLTNASTVTTQGVSTGVDLGRPRIIVNPRIARIGARFVW